MELEASASTARRLYFLFKGLQSFLSSVTIQFDEDGLSFQGMD
jgi:proliferating cell nuclear antigen